MAKNISARPGAFAGDSNCVTYACADDMNPEIRIADDMRWVEGGAGPVIMPLHGLFGEPSNWTGLLEYFNPFARVVIPVLPVYTLPLVDAHIRTLVHFVERFVDRHGLTDINIIGNSLGGQIAVLYTRMHGERVNTMTLTGSSGLGENSLVGSLLRSGSSPRRADYALVRSIIETTFHDPQIATKEMVDEIYDLVNHDAAKVANIIAIIKSAMRQEIVSLLPLIEHPTCLIWGRNDVVTPATVADEFQRLLPHAELFWIDQCGHVPIMEQPAQFNAALHRWYQARGVLARGLAENAENAE